MSAVTVVTPQNMVEFITTGKVSATEELPPTRRERLALKRSGTPEAKSEPKVEAKKEPDAKPAEKAEPKFEVKIEAKDAKSPVNDSEKLDDKPKPAVKESPADAMSADAMSADEVDENGLTAAQRAEYTERVRKTIGEKHRRAKEAEEFATLQRQLRLDAEKRVKELEAELAKAKPKAEPAPTKAKADKPKPEDFANVAEYTDALTDWKIDQREAQRAQKQTETEQAERESKASQTWQTRLAAAVEANPEFMTTVQKAFTPEERVAKSVMTYIEESDLGPQLLFRLATHADELATFRSLNAEKAIGYLGRLEAKLESAKAPKEEPKPKEEPAPKVEAKVEPAPVKNVSKAPPPVDTSVGSGESVRKDPSEMTTEEYLAHRKSQRRAQAR